MLTDYARYLWFRLTHTWYGLVYAVLYVAISLASGASVARSLRGFMIPVAREQWHTDCLGVYGDIVASDGENDYDATLTDCKLHCTGCQRTGCMFCGFGAHLEKGENRFERMKHTHPKHY